MYRCTSVFPCISGDASWPMARSCIAAARTHCTIWRVKLYGNSRTFALGTSAISTRWRMVDRERVLAKLDALHGYERELGVVLPASVNDYKASLEKRRATERLLQISVECVLDICGLLVAGLRLGLPADEENLFDRLEQAHILSPDLVR